MPKEIEVKSILNKTKKRDSWFLDDYTINLYSSCSFNCLYCYIRGSKYGENLASSLAVKTNAIEILDRQLFNRAKKGDHGIIVVSSATDPYLKIEQEYQLTRQALELILKYKFPVHVITKSNLIERDFDLLKRIEEVAILPNDLVGKLPSGVIVSFSFSTVDDAIAKIFEPGATKPSVRIETVKNTLSQKLFTGISMMPLLPFITDTTAHLERLFSTFKSCQVDYILPATLTLFGSGKSASKTLVFKAIEKHYPELIARYQGYFQNGSQMPDFYQKAFYKKMKELCLTHELADSILIGAAKRIGAQ